MDNTRFLISDTRTLRQQKLRCSSRDISVPFLVAPPNSLNGTEGVSSTSELISVTEETDSTVCSSKTTKIESKISCGLGDFKQS